MALGTPATKATPNSASDSLTLGPSSSFSASAGDLLVVSIGSYASLANVGTPSAIADDGAVLHFVPLNAWPATAANAPSIAQWAALLASDFTGTVLVTFALAQRGSAAAVVAISGVSKAEPVRMANLATGAGTGLGATSTLPLALAGATHVHLYAVAHQKNEVTTPGAGFTELADIAFADGGSGTEFALEVGYAVNAQAAAPSWASSVAYATASLEIQVAVVTVPDIQAVYAPVWLLEVAAA